MADLKNRVGAADIENAMSRLRGVISARVVTDAQGVITEIHVVGDSGRHPKQLSRDIESAIFSEFGVRIDHRKISIAQVRSEREEAAAEIRLKFLGIDYSLDRTTAKVRVSVGRGEDSFTGIAAMPVGAELDQERLVARATLAAIEEFFKSSGGDGNNLGLELRELIHSKDQAYPSVMVMVRIVGDRGKEELLGSALIRDDPWRAAACATLDALNRRLPALYLRD